MKFTTKDLREQEDNDGVIGETWFTNWNGTYQIGEPPKYPTDFEHGGKYASIFTEMTQNSFDNRKGDETMELKFELKKVPMGVLKKHFLDDELLLQRIDHMHRNSIDFENISPDLIWKAKQSILADEDQGYVLVVTDNGKGIQGPVLFSRNSDSDSALSTLLLGAGQGQKGTKNGMGSKGKGTSTLFMLSDLKAFLSVSKRVPSTGGEGFPDVSRLAFGSRIDGQITLVGAANNQGKTDELRLDKRSLRIKERKKDEHDYPAEYVPFFNDDEEITEIIEDFGISIENTGTAFIIPVPNETFLTKFEQLARVPTLRFSIPIAKEDLEVTCIKDGVEILVLNAQTVGDEFLSVDTKDIEIVGRMKLTNGKNVLNGLSMERKTSMNRLRNEMQNVVKKVVNNTITPLPVLTYNVDDQRFEDADGKIVFDCNTNYHGSDDTTWSQSKIASKVDDYEAGKCLGFQLNIKYNEYNESGDTSRTGKVAVAFFKPTSSDAELAAYHRNWMLIPAVEPKGNNKLVIGMNVMDKNNEHLHLMLRRSESEGHNNWRHQELGTLGKKGSQYYDSAKIIPMLREFPITLHSIMFPSEDNAEVWTSPFSLPLDTTGDNAEEPETVCAVCGQQRPCECPNICPVCGQERPCECPSDNIGINGLEPGEIRLTKGKSNLPVGSRIQLNFAYAIKGSKGDLKKYNPSKDGAPSTVTVTDEAGIVVVQDPHHDQTKGGICIVFELTSTNWSATVCGLSVNVSGDEYNEGVLGDYFIDYDTILPQVVSA